LPPGLVHKPFAAIASIICFAFIVIGRLITGHRWALQNRQVNGLVNMPELWLQSA
jgi:hypothetical protein